MADTGPAANPFDELEFPEPPVEMPAASKDAPAGLARRMRIPPPPPISSLPPPVLDMQGTGTQRHLTTAQAAKFATLAYIYGSGQGSEEDKREQVKQELEGTGWTMKFKHSNRQLSTLYNESKNHLHVAHKGTQPNSSMGMLDLASDLRLAVGQEHKSYQFNYRLRETERIYNTFKPKTFTMSGHSLGGATVIYALEKSKLLIDAIDQADTFNAGAAPWPKVMENLKYLNPFKYSSLKREDNRRKRKLNDVLTHHRMENDFVSVSMRARPPHGEVRMYPLEEAVGDDRRKELREMNFVSKGLEAHHLHHFEDAEASHMNNYKSTNYKGGSGKKRSAPSDVDSHPPKPIKIPKPIPY